MGEAIAPLAPPLATPLPTVKKQIENLKKNINLLK
jgi:hypothetical protein